MKTLLAATLAALASMAWAHDVTTEFPHGARSLSAEALRSALENREFTAKPAEGPTWRLKYDQNGDFSVRAGSFVDEGKWHTNESAVCTEGKTLKPLCNGVRVKDGKLFLQRKGGEVMQLIPM